MRKRIFQAGAAVILGLGGWTAVHYFGSETPTQTQTSIDLAPNHAEIKLSERALELHAEVTEEVAARVAAENQAASDERPKWLQDVVDRGYVDDRYADLMLRDDYLQAVQEQFHVLQHDPKAREQGGCDVLGVDGGESLCWNEWGYSPYLAYDMNSLRSMAQTDAAAAEALALRTKEREGMLYYSMRATQLSGRPGPIVRFLGRSRSSSQRHDHEELLQAYVLSLIVDEMGYPYRHSTEFAYWLEVEQVPQQVVADALVAGFVITEPAEVGQ